tara:strand:- start:232 stop:858 length:627 start_codon:yes stop_codon:yes gene_type:complete
MNEKLPLPYGNLTFPNTQNQTATLTSTTFNNTITVNGITYPLVDGTDGQAIVTDGNGNLNFETVGGTGNVLSVNGETGAVVLNKTDIGLSNVDNQSVSTILSNSNLTGTSSIEKIIQEVQNYTGAGPHDLTIAGKLNNIVTHNDSSVVTLPLNPDSGFITRVINYGNGSITINTQTPNEIDTIGISIELTNYLDKSTFLFVNNVWNLI